MATWKKVTFVTVLVVFIGLSVLFTFYSIARDTFEYKYAEADEEIGQPQGWMFFGFNGNTGTKEIYLDYVRDEKGQNPDETKPLTSVGSFTIVSDEYVEYIYIGKDLRYISEDSFFYLKQLKAVFVDEENEYFCSVDGVLFSKDKKELILHPIRNGEYVVEEGISETSDTYDIPDGTEVIRSYSFYKNGDLVHLTIPNSVKKIGDMAFFSCGRMWTVWLNEGLEEIGNDAFSYCGSYSPILYIPKTVKTIGSNAFFSCGSIREIYMGAESEEGMDLGESWRPKSIQKAVLFVAPEPEFGKTLEDAVLRKEVLDGEAQ